MEDLFETILEICKMNMMKKDKRLKWYQIQKSLFTWSISLKSVCGIFKKGIFNQKDCDAFSGFLLNYLEKILNIH